jgi:hypothetical protein
MAWYGPIIMNAHVQLRRAMAELREEASSGIRESSHERPGARRSADPVPLDTSTFMSD